MRIKALITLVFLVLASACAKLQLSPPKYSSLEQSGQPIKLKGIGRDKAISAVKDHVSKTVRRLLNFDIAGCEEVLFWRVIFDGSNREYLVDKKSSRIVKVEHIPHGAVGSAMTVDTNQVRGYAVIP